MAQPDRQTHTMLTTATPRSPQAMSCGGCRVDGACCALCPSGGVCAVRFFENAENCGVVATTICACDRATGDPNLKAGGLIQYAGSLPLGRQWATAARRT